MRRLTLSAFAVLLYLGGWVRLSAQSIPLANASFETPPVAVGAKTTGGIPGWNSFIPFACTNGNVETTGVYHPLTSQVSPPSDGSQLGYFQACGDSFENQAIISQTLPVNYSPNTGYTFTMDFFRDSSSTVPIDAHIGFCYGPAAFAQTHVCTEAYQMVPTAGGSASATLFVNNGSPYLGSPITIFIFKGSGNLSFDNARLEATPRVAHSSGLVGMFAHRQGVTSQLNALCSNAGTAPCDLALEFHDIHGVLVSQKQVTLRPGEATSLDQPVSRDFMPVAGELIPRWFLKAGVADFSFEILDNSTMRSNFFINWGDGSVAKMFNLDSGPVGITSLDTVRAKAYCDGSVRADESASPVTPCAATLGFVDAASGRTLKTSRVLLQPGTGAYLDINYEETPQTTPRQQVIPQLKANTGNIVGGFAVLDRATGGTVTQSFPVTPASTNGDR